MLYSSDKADNALRDLARALIERGRGVAYRALPTATTLAWAYVGIHLHQVARDPFGDGTAAVRLGGLYALERPTVTAN
ncbi:hypothetical protein HerbRD11066_17360 [Herbidospora sp. RD11066]